MTSMVSQQQMSVSVTDYRKHGGSVYLPTAYKVFRHKLQGTASVTGYPSSLADLLLKTIFPSRISTMLPMIVDEQENSRALLLMGLEGYSYHNV